MVARILAVVAAVAMVVAAVAVRSRIDHDSTSGDGATATGALVCSTEVAPVCDGAASAPAPETTRDLLQGGGSGVGDWLATGPWPTAVNDAVGAAGRQPPFGTIRVVARSPLVVVLHRTRGRELRTKCPQLTWKCLGDAAVAGVPIGAPPAAEGEGVLIRAAAAGGYLGRSDFASNDLDEDPGLLPWLEGFDRSVVAARQQGAADYGRFLQIPGAAAYVTTEAEAATVPPGFERLRLEPLAIVDIYLASAAPEVPPPVTASVQTLLRSGWVAPDSKGLPEDDGLPSAGVLQALQEVLH